MPLKVYAWPVSTPRRMASFSAVGGWQVFSYAARHLAGATTARLHWNVFSAIFRQLHFVKVPK